MSQQEANKVGDKPCVIQMILGAIAFALLAAVFYHFGHPNWLANL